jgi:arginine/lysine/ornithine decarboxylase
VREGVEKLKNDLVLRGFVLMGSEPFKLTLDIKKSGVSTENLVYVLDKFDVECEFMDDEYAVFMFSTCSSERDFHTVEKVLDALEIGEVVVEKSVEYSKGEKVLSVRNAIMSDSEIISVASSLGRTCASPLVSCPPAIPIVVSGEKITQQSIALLLKYGITEIEVTK